MLTIEVLRACGADTKAGLAQCLNDESLYLSLVGMLLNDGRFEALAQAVKSVDAHNALHLAHGLLETASGLALTPLAQRLEQMVLCLQLQGDSAVVEKEWRIIELGLEQLRLI